MERNYEQIEQVSLIKFLVKEKELSVADKKQRLEDLYRINKGLDKKSQSKKEQLEWHLRRTLGQIEAYDKVLDFIEKATKK